VIKMSEGEAIFADARSVREYVRTEGTHKLLKQLSSIQIVSATVAALFVIGHIWYCTRLDREELPRSCS